MSNPRDKIEAKLGLSGPPLQTVRDSPPAIPDHEFIRRIGQGAYGEVWLARNALGTWRAVKIVYRDNFKDARPYEREFAGIRRFEPLSRSNEGFVDVLQVGLDDAGGWFYYVMELADGVGEGDGRLKMADGIGASEVQRHSPSSIFNPRGYQPRTLARDLHHRSRLPLEDCLQLGLTLTLALGHLHRHGLIHRDIKPSNIIFVGGVPKLADIGLVTEAQGANTFVGTEGFVPPEGPTSPQADLYALGKVLYEAAMGKDRNEFPEPFTQIGTDHESMALMELSAVLLRACAPDPKKRYASAEEMHADLALLHSGGSVKRRHQFDRQFQIAKQVGAVAIAATLLIGAALFWQRQQTQKMTRLAEEKSTLATEKTKLADNLAKLGEENRDRIVRLDIANGVRLLDEGDPAGALLWFADALPLLTNNPAQESIHRIRIQQTLNQMPRIMQVFPHEHDVSASDLSKDGRYLVTGTDWGFLRVWDARSGAPLWPPLALGAHSRGFQSLNQVGFAHDGEKVFVSTVPPRGFREEETPTAHIAAIIESRTGKRVFSLSATNLVQAGLSPDDRWLVTADSEHSIHVYDARNGVAVSNFKAHSDRIRQLLFSEADDLLISSSEDGTARLWHLPDGKPMGSPIPNDTGPVVLSPDGALLLRAKAAVSAKGETNSLIQIWDTATAAKAGAPIEVQGVIGRLWFPPAREGVLFVLTSKQCTVFDIKTRAQLVSLPRGASVGKLFSVTEDARRIAFAGPDGVEGVWNLETGERLLPSCLRGWNLRDVNFSPDGSKLFAASAGGALLMISTAARPQEHTTFRLDGPVASGSPRPFLEWQRFTPDRRFFLLILKHGEARRVDFERMAVEPLLEDSVTGLIAQQITYDKTGRQGAINWAGNGTNLVRMWSETNGTTNRFTLPLPARLYNQFLFTSDGNCLITPCADGVIRFWRTLDGALERTIPIQTVSPSIVFPDGQRALAVSADTHRFALLRFGDQPITELPFHGLGITALGFSPAGDRFAFASDVDWTRVCKTLSCEPLTPPLNHGGEVRWADWSPDGKRLATAGLTSEVKVWDASTGEQLLTPLRLGAKPIETAQWSLDGRFIVARSDENTVRVWDAATGEPVTPILQHDGYVRLAHLVMSNRLVTITLPDVVRAWDLVETKLPADFIADYASLVSGRRLNAAGVVVPMSPSEVADLGHSLRQRAPELFPAQ